jgi:predicted aspartyl protease
MMLSLDNGTVFARSSAPYGYLPEESPRINIQIEVEGNRLSAVIDTGAPYLVCGQQTADALRIPDSGALEEIVLSTRKGRLKGKLYRVAVTVLAADGESIELEATVFVPDNDSWDDEPLFLGLLNCLDRLRFAVDPVDEVFYFGKP